MKVFVYISYVCTVYIYYVYTHTHKFSSHTLYKQKLILYVTNVIDPFDSLFVDLFKANYIIFNANFRQ